MSESYSLNDLIKTGMNPEQFKAKYTVLKENAGFSEQFSIFDDGDIEDALDNIFNAADVNSDGTIDENELIKIKEKFKDTNQDEISENDIKMLYQEAMFKQYLNHSPQDMYNIAYSNVEDYRELNYIEMLDNNISAYEDFISSRKITSQKNIQKYQDEIDDIIMAAADKKGIDTSNYEKLSSNAASLEEQINKDTLILQQKERELDAAKKQAKQIENEINNLKSNSESEEIEISSREHDLNELYGKIYNLSTGIDLLKARIKSNKISLSPLKKEISKIQKNIIKNNIEATDRVKELKEKIEQEKKDAENDINNYNKKIKILSSAREYAYKKITSSKPTKEIATDYSNRGENVTSFKAVNYSASKGQKLAQYMKNHAVGFTGYCSRHVSNGLAGTGLGHERTASAHMMDTELDKNSNFRRISVSSLDELKNLPAGCIIVYEAGAEWNNGYKRGHYNAKHGHIEVTLGNGTACSDGITRNMRYSDKMSIFVPVE